MKKICLALFFFCFVFTGLFADGADKLFSAGLKVFRDAYFIRAFTGSFADDDSAAKIADGNTIYPYQGGSETGIFNPSRFLDSGLDAWLGFGYSGEQIGGYVNLLLYTPEQTSSYTAISDRLDVKSEIEGWVKVGPWFDAVSLRFTFGNLEQLGSIPQYADFDDLLQFRQGGMGAAIPINTINERFSRFNLTQGTKFPYGYEEAGSVTGLAEFSYINVSDLFTPAGDKTNPFGFLIDIETNYVTLSASVGGLFDQLLRPFGASWEGWWNRPNQDNIYDPNRSDDLLTDSTTNYGFRLESTQIADLVTVAVLYKYGELVRIKHDPQQNPVFNQFDMKRQNHEFALYFNLQPLPNLGISAGYSGLIENWSSKYIIKIDSMPSWIADEEVYKYWYAQYGKTEMPFYHGVDLKMFYSGIPKLGITFNNNVTFSTVNAYEPDGGKLYRPGWIYAQYLQDVTDRKEQYIGLNNVLCLKYNIGDSLTADLQLANQLGIFSLLWTGGSAVSFANNLGLYAGIIYRIWEKEIFKASVQCGFALAMRSYQYQNAYTGKKYNAGYLDFGIPLGIKLEF